MRKYDQPRQHIKKQRYHFADKGSSSQSYGFSNSYVWMWELDHKESWASKNWSFWTVVLEKALESPLDSKIQPVYPKGNQTLIFFEGLMLKLKLQYFGHLMQRTDSLKKIQCWERLKVGGEGNNKGWDSWMSSPTWWTLSSSKLRELVMDREDWLATVHGGHKESDMTEQLNWTIPYIITSERIKYIGINLIRKWKAFTLKTIRHWWNILKKVYTNGKICVFMNWKN